jgi:pyrimidine oxygenase
MGILPEGYDQRRYEYASEWIHVLKRLWVEDSVTHHGEFFDLEDCVSEPKPIQRPYPRLICAASSDEGLRFTAREANYSFINGNDLEQVKQQSLHSKKIAEEEGSTIKTAASTLLGLRDTTEEANSYWEYLMDGADLEGIHNMGTAFGQRTRESKKRGAEILDGRRKIFTSKAIVGSPQVVADEIIGLALEGDVDGILLILPDYIDGLNRFGNDVLPLLSQVLDVGLSSA